MRLLATTTWGIPQGLLIAIAIVLSVIALWAIIDAITRPAAAFEQVGQTKPMWLVLLILTGLMCGPIGTVVAIYYLASVRPKLKSAA